MLIPKVFWGHSTTTAGKPLKDIYKTSEEWPDIWTEQQSGRWPGTVSAFFLMIWSITGKPSLPCHDTFTLHSPSKNKCVTIYIVLMSGNNIKNMISVVAVSGGIRYFDMGRTVSDFLQPWFQSATPVLSFIMRSAIPLFIDKAHKKPSFSFLFKYKHSNICTRITQYWCE